jgi:hypothetical protein
MEDMGYYSNVRSALKDLMAGVKGVSEKLNNLSGEEKMKTMPYLNQLNMTIEELTDEIKGFEKMSATKYDSYSGKWEFKHAEEGETVEEVIPEPNEILETANPT